MYQLLADEAANEGGKMPSWVSWIFIGLLVVVLIVSMVLMNRRSKKREQEAQALIDAVKPGNKVKTIGGVCGIVVEVDPVEDTFVIETGSESSGKCYMKFVRQAILESDAVVGNAPAAPVEAPAEAPAEPFEETSASSVDEIVKEETKEDVENSSGDIKDI